MTGTVRCGVGGGAPEGLWAGGGAGEVAADVRASRAEVSRTLRPCGKEVKR